MRLKQWIVSSFSALLLATPAAAQEGKLIVKTYEQPAQSFFEKSKHATLVCEQGSNRLIHGTVAVQGVGLWAVREQEGYGPIGIFQPASGEEEIVMRIARVPHELCEGDPDAATVITALRQAATRQTSTAFQLKPE